MWFSSTGIVATCALLALTRSQGSSEADENFNTQALFDSNVTMYCNGSTQVQGDFKVDFWIRPDTNVPMLPGDVDTFRILDGEASWEVSRDGMELWVGYLQERQFGVYICVGTVGAGTPSSRVVVLRQGLNVDGPYFGNLWPEYRLNTIIGISASGCYLLVVAILYGTYHFRYRGEEGEEGEKEGGNERDMSDFPAEVIETVATTDGTGDEHELFPRTRWSTASRPSAQEFQF